MTPARIRPLAAEEVEAVLDLITAEQQQPATGTCYLGTERAGLRAELEDLGAAAWPGSVLVAEVDGRIVGAALADTDEELGRSWIQGPWVRGGDEAWGRWARPLLQGVIVARPATITRHEISGDVANHRMAALAAELGWRTSVPNHVFTLGEAATAGWPADDDRVRPSTPEDFAAIDPLHRAEFPHTYLNTRQMLAQTAAGDLITVVSESGGRFLGYASGRVQPDGEGYLDFVAVAPDARGCGTGLGLTSTVVRRILAAAPRHILSLTVQDHRAPAVALYGRLGFTLETTIVGYSSPSA